MSLLPDELRVPLPAGTFRVLDWPGHGHPVVFLHGLTAVADVWQATVDALGAGRLRCIAPDQRAHGHSPRSALPYGVERFVEDLLGIMDALSVERPHLVGHSMGGRVAMVAAARHPGRFRSVSIVDIGPEQWRANWVETVEALRQMPGSFASEADAYRFGSRGKAFEEPWHSAFFARLARQEDGTLRWLADIDALAEIVRLHRSRNYWRAWERLEPPALLVRGERSKELRPRIAAEMRRRNPAVGFVEIPGAPHNLPLAAPAYLAEVLARFWARC